MTTSHEKFTHNRLRSGGFTMLELLVVIAIIGVITAIGFGPYSDYRRSVQFQDAFMSVSQRITSTSAESLKYNRVYTLTLSSGQAAKGKMTASTNPPTPAVDYTLENGAYISQVLSGSLPLSPAAITFNGRGRPNITQPVNITVNLGTRSRVVRILPSGKVVLP